MSKGYIVAQLFTARQARPITNATVIISRPGTGGESIIRTVEVDREGKTEPIEVDTLPKSLSLDETYEGVPYTTYDITIRAFNFANQLIRRVQVFEAQTTLQQVELIPFDREAYTNNTDFIFETPAHSLAKADCEPDCPPQQQLDQPRLPENPIEREVRPQVLQSVIVPSQIVVHLGTPRSNAENVYVSFPDYIKMFAPAKFTLPGRKMLSAPIFTRRFPWRSTGSIRNGTPAKDIISKLRILPNMTRNMSKDEIFLRISAALWTIFLMSTSAALAPEGHYSPNIAMGGR